MADVIELGGITKLDIDPDKVLNVAIGNVDSAVVVGYDKEGKFYFASSIADGADIVWLMELAKKYLIEAAEELTTQGEY